MIYRLNRTAVVFVCIYTHIYRAPDLRRGTRCKTVRCAHTETLTDVTHPLKCHFLNMLILGQGGDYMTDQLHTHTVI